MEAFVNILASKDIYKFRLLKDMKKVVEILSNPHFEVIRPLYVDYNFNEKNEDKCWSIQERHFL